MTPPPPVLAHARQLGRDARDRALSEPVHDERTAALLGIALGVSFLVCFLTGVTSHLIQNPTSWFHWPARPVGLYRLLQGVHVATGLATVPLLLAKLWSVFPNLFRWPPVTSLAHAVERLMLVPLVCGSVFMLFSGAANIAQWYPWHFAFPVVHYWVAWMTMGALVAHVGAKFATTRAALAHAAAADEIGVAARDGMTRRGFLAGVGATAAFFTFATVGQTFRPLRRLAVFAPRRPDIGPQGLPVNGTPSLQLAQRARSADYRLSVVGDVAEPLSLRRADLEAMRQHQAILPIACVEGWSADAHWRGVPVRDLLHRAGVPAHVAVEVVVDSMQHDSHYRRSLLSNGQARDSDTLIALELNGAPLHMDHGYPCRLIGPNRPGVQQTKWVESLTVHRV